MRVPSLLLSAALLLGVLLPFEAFAPRLLSAGAAEVQGRAERLKALFARLSSTNDSLEGDAIVEEIWRLWLISGRPEIDAMMQNALALVEAGRPQAAMPLLDSIVERAPEGAEGWNKGGTVLYVFDGYDGLLAVMGKVLAVGWRHYVAIAR